MSWPTPSAASPKGEVHIDDVPALGDWKTAWDHIAFDGFLGSRMILQTIWQGCDSALAAPLVLDLARLVARAHEAGSGGPARRSWASTSRTRTADRRRWRSSSTALLGLRRAAASVPVKGLRLTRPRSDWAELLRVSALFTVPGDALAGAAAAGVRPKAGARCSPSAPRCASTRRAWR